MASNEDHCHGLRAPVPQSLRQQSNAAPLRDVGCGAVALYVASSDERAPVDATCRKHHVHPLDVSVKPA